MFPTKSLMVAGIPIVLLALFIAGAFLQARGAIGNPRMSDVERQAKGKREDLKLEITKLVGDLRDNSTETQEKAIVRLKQIGVPALESLYRQETDPNTEVRARVNSVIKAIRLANKLPPRVDGLEFELSVDKVWLTPEPDQESDIKLELIITNVSGKSINLNFNNVTTVVLRNEKGSNWTAKGGGGNLAVDLRGTFATVPKSAAVKMLFPAKLIHGVTSKTKTTKNDLVFWYIDPWLYGGSKSSGLFLGEFQISLTYENKLEASKVEPSMRFWTGTSGVLTEPIVVRRKEQK